MNNASRKDQKPVPTIVVSRPAIMQQSLRVILRNSPEVEVIASAGDGLSAMLLVRQHHPGLLVIDHNLLEEEIQGLLLTIKNEFPITKCLVIVPSKRREAHLIAQGADSVVLRDAPPQDMRAAILQLAHEASLLID